MYLMLAFLLLLLEHSHKFLDVTTPPHCPTVHSKSADALLCREERTEETNRHLER